MVAGKQTGPYLNLRFVPQDYANETAPIMGIGVPTLGPTPSPQAETYQNSQTNPHGFVQIRPVFTERGNVAASQNMAFSMAPAFNGGASLFNPPKKNTQQAPVFTRGAYGPSLLRGNTARPEGSVYATGGGNPLYVANNGRTALTRNL